MSTTQLFLKRKSRQEEPPCQALRHTQLPKNKNKNKWANGTKQGAQKQPHIHVETYTIKAMSDSWEMMSFQPKRTDYIAKKTGSKVNSGCIKYLQVQEKKDKDNRKKKNGEACLCDLEIKKDFWN